MKEAIATELPMKNDINNEDQATYTSFFNDVCSGLSSTPKTLPCKYFYDETGSQLFEEITQLSEYYVTRTELAILDKHAQEIAEYIKDYSIIIEPGSGAGIKIQKILCALPIETHTFIPLEISKDALAFSVTSIRKTFPDLKLKPLEGDFTNEDLINRLSKNAQLDKSANVVFFPGSTIGNFTKEKAVTILKNFKQLCGSNGKILIGIDLLKDTDTLLAAYDDQSGVTAEFNKNILHRINNELDANFDVENGFKHQAIFNTNLSRIEMHLVSLAEQSIALGDKTFHFKKAESIHTENSHKYSIDSFTMIASLAGLEIEHLWQDTKEHFALLLLKCR